METKTIRAAIAAALMVATSATLPSFADRTLDDGLAVYMPFDASATENAVAGSVVAPTAGGSPTSVSGGAFGNCLDIPSSTKSYVKLDGSDTSSLTYDNDNKSFTALVWANYASQTGDPLIFCNRKGWSGGQKGVLLCAKSNSQDAQFHVCNGTSSSTKDDKKVRFDKYFTGEGSGKWTLYVMVCSNGDFTMYQGKSDGGFSLTHAGTLSAGGFDLASGYPFVLGQTGDCGYSKNFNGKLDDFGLWTRPLTEAAVRRIHEYGLLGASLGDLLSVETNSTVSAVMVATSLAGASGNEPDGLYIVDGARTFTAPASVEVGGHGYTPTGYTLERRSASTGEWESDGEGVHAGASYVHTSSENDADVRITWQWMDADEPAIAVWTGAANNNDLADAGNWSCTNTLGYATVAPVTPDERTTKIVLAADADWTATNLTLAAGVALDLNGHRLYVTNSFGASGLVGATDYVKNGSFESGHAVASGSWKYTSADDIGITSDFSWTPVGAGGITRENSTWKKVAAPDGSAAYFLPGGTWQGAGRSVYTTVEVPCSGYYALSFYYGARGTGDNANSTLYVDLGSTSNIWHATCSSTAATFVTLNGIFLEKGGNVLQFRNEKSADKDQACWIDAVAVKRESTVIDSSSDAANPGELHIVVPAETTYDDNSYYLYGNLRVAKEGAGALSVPTSRWYFTGGIDVSAGTLSMSGPVAFVAGGSLGGITVASGAKVVIPATDGLMYGEAFTLNGGTLELALSGTATPVTTYITNSVALNAGSKMYFDMADLDTTEFILSTDGFVLGEGVESAVACAELSRPAEAMAEADGANAIRITVLTEAATATYIGGGSDPLDFTDPDNWACTNAVGGGLSGKVPLGVTAVTISGATAFQVTNGAAFACASVTFDDATLPDNADLRGLDLSKVTSDSVIDLQGRTLLLADETSATLGAFTITDTSLGAPGTVRISVASGTLSNGGLALTGNLRLQKEGAGTFIPAKAGQTYSGGTDLSNGTIRVTATVSGHLGTGVVTVPSNTVFDVYGNVASNVTMVLAGGTLQNSAATDGTLPKVLTLTEDSRVVHANASSGSNDMTVPNKCQWNLGGKTLFVSMSGNDSDFNFSKSGPNIVSNGTISVSVGTASGKNGGYFAIRQVNGSDGLKLDLGNTNLRLQDGSGNSSVVDLTADPIGNVYSYSSNRLQIYGTFTPKTVTGFNMTMMDGSTLDLSQLTGAYDCAFPGNEYKSGSATCSLQFASGTAESPTMVKVALGDRTKEELKEIIDGDGLIVKWTTEPGANIKFSADDATLERGYKVKRVEGGLRLLKLKGLTIIIH